MVCMEPKPHDEPRNGKGRESKIPLLFACGSAVAGLVLLGGRLASSEDDSRLPLVSPGQQASPYTAVTPASRAPHPLAITNTSDHPIEISSNPNAGTKDTARGSLAVGESAMASCVVPNIPYPHNTKLYIVATEQGPREGYISVYPAHYIGNHEPDPREDQPQISATLEDINEAHFPKC